jgi:hypothetical protein
MCRRSSHLFGRRFAVLQKQLSHTTCLNISYKLIAISAPMRMMIVCTWQTKALQSCKLCRQWAIHERSNQVPGKLATAEMN